METATGERLRPKPWGLESIGRGLAWQKRSERSGAMNPAEARLCDVAVGRTFGRRDPSIERERALAVIDLFENNSFLPVGHGSARVSLHLGSQCSCKLAYRKLLARFMVDADKDREVRRIAMPPQPYSSAKPIERRRLAVCGIFARDRGDGFAAQRAPTDGGAPESGKDISDDQRTAAARPD